MKTKLASLAFISTVVAVTIFLLLAQSSNTPDVLAGPDLQLRRPTNFYFEVAAGNVRDHSTINKFGYNSDIDAGTAEDIWDGSTAWNEPTATQVYTITSTSANDTAAGTGARTVQIYGLDSAGALQNETVTLAGTSWVTPTNQYQMIHRMIVRTAGSGGVNAGIISANATDDATVTAQINAGNNQTLMAIYKIPAGNEGCMIGLYAAVNRKNATGNADIYLYAKPSGEVWQVKHLSGVMATGTSHLQHYFEPPHCFEPLTLLRISGDVSANNTDISAGFDMVLRPN